MPDLVRKIANDGLRNAISEYGLDAHPEILKATVRMQWEQYIEESIRIAQDLFERDPLGLTQPPPDLSHRWNILEGHGPEEADVWDDRANVWTFCFAVYRKVVCGNPDREIADMLCHSSTGSVALKYNRLHTTKGGDGRVAYRYVKFSQDFVNTWVEEAMDGLYNMHGDEKYISSLLPWNLLR